VAEAEAGGGACGECHGRGSLGPSTGQPSGGGGLGGGGTDGVRLFDE